jgi:hypothetical protein
LRYAVCLMLLPELPTQIHHQRRRRLWRRLLYTRPSRRLLHTRFPLLWRKVCLHRSRIVLGNSVAIRLVEEPAVEFLGLHHRCRINLRWCIRWWINRSGRINREERHRVVARQAIGYVFQIDRALGIIGLHSHGGLRQCYGAVAAGTDRVAKRSPRPFNSAKQIIPI